MRSYQVTLYGSMKGAGSVVRRVRVDAHSYDGAIRASKLRGDVIGVKAL